MKISKAQQQTISIIYKYATNEGANTVELITRLFSIGNSLRKSYEYSCNYAQDEKQEARRDKRETRLETEAAEIAKELGAVLYLQTDPRGCPLHLLFPSQINYDNIGEGRSYPTLKRWIDSNYTQGICLPTN